MRYWRSLVLSFFVGASASAMVSGHEVAAYWVLVVGFLFLVSIAFINDFDDICPQTSKPKSGESGIPLSSGDSPSEWGGQEYFNADSRDL